MIYLITQWHKFKTLKFNLKAILRFLRIIRTVKSNDNFKATQISIWRVVDLSAKFVGSLSSSSEQTLVDGLWGNK